MTVLENGGAVPALNFSKTLNHVHFAIHTLPCSRNEHFCNVATLNKRVVGERVNTNKPVSEMATYANSQAEKAEEPEERR